MAMNILQMQTNMASLDNGLVCSIMNGLKTKNWRRQFVG